MLELNVLFLSCVISLAAYCPAICILTKKVEQAKEVNEGLFLFLTDELWTQAVDRKHSKTYTMLDFSVIITIKIIIASF